MGDYSNYECEGNDQGSDPLNCQLPSSGAEPRCVVRDCSPVTSNVNEARDHEDNCESRMDSEPVLAREGSKSPTNLACDAPVWGDE